MTGPPRARDQPDKASNGGDRLVRPVPQGSPVGPDGHDDGDMVVRSCRRRCRACRDCRRGVAAVCPVMVGVCDPVGMGGCDG